MFLKIFCLSELVGALQREQQLVAGHLPQELLHAAILELGEIVEHEHQILDARAEGLIGLPGSAP